MIRTIKGIFLSLQSAANAVRMKLAIRFSKTSLTVRLIALVKRWSLRLALTTLAAGLSLQLGSLAHASSIQQRAISEVAGQAALIFVGVVVDKQVKAQANGTHTLVTFSIDEIIKGDYKRDSLVLDFAGGEMGDQSQVISGLVYPESGESGIYFVESLDQLLVNPLLGWSQGHFKLKEGKVYSNELKPVVDLQPFAPKAQANQLSEGFANGIELGGEQDIAMDKELFIQSLRVLVK